MARVSGLASEHHPMGPGDAPRRRVQKATTPPPETTGNKRAASPGDRSTPIKRTRLASDDLDDQLAREVNESAARSQSTLHSVMVTARHVRRNSEPVVAFADEEEDELAQTPVASTQPLPGLTPHLKRLGAPRGRPTNANRRARMSMPAHFRIDTIDEVNGSQIQYAPFKATLDSRTRRRLKRNHLAEEINELETHQKEDRKLRKLYAELKRQLDEKNKQIESLEFQLEARRMGEIDLTEDETEGLREQLSQAKQEIEDLRASSIYRGDSRDSSAFDLALDTIDDYEDEDDEPLLVIDPADPDGPAPEEVEPLPNGEFASRVLAISSQVTVDSLRTLSETAYDHVAELSQHDPEAVPDRLSGQAVKRYETEIQRLIELLGEAQGALRLVAIELQNANILPPGADTKTITDELRSMFDNLRDEMEKLVPRCTVGLTNSQFLAEIPALFQNLLAELGEKATAAEKFYQESRIYRAQFENTMGLLERSEARNDDLDTKVADLEEKAAQDQETNEELEERVLTLDALVADQDVDLKKKDDELSILRGDIEDKDTDLLRLREALDKYRTDLDNLTETTTRLEEEHRVAIATLEENHNAAILDLQQQLEDENEARLQAEGEAEQKSEYIDELEQNIERIEQEVTAMTEELESLRERLETETDEHSTTKATLEEESVQLYESRNKIENLQEELDKLNAELTNTRAELETERATREETAAQLEEANKQIEDLEARLREEGMEAQELRSKLFQAQVEREEAVKNLEEDAQESNAAYELTIESVTLARDTAEQTIAERDAEIAQLQDDLAARTEEIEQAEAELTAVEADRDDHINALERQLEDLHHKYTALENTSASTIASLNANITDLTNEVNDLKSQLAALTASATETETQLRDELDTRDATIEELRTDLATAREDYSALDDKYLTEIERFAEESAQYFDLQNKHVRERNALSDKVQNLEALLSTRESEVQELQVTVDARAETIAEQHAQMEEMKEAFAAAEQDTRDTIDRLTESQRALQQQNEALAEALKKRNADAVQAVRDMRVKGLTVKNKTVDLHRVATGKVSKVSEKLRIGKKGKAVKQRGWRDSGFGAGSDVENDEEVDDTEVDELAAIEV